MEMRRTLKILAVALATVAILPPFLLRDGAGLGTASILSLSASGLWVALLAFAFARAGRWAVWLLLSAPLALYWPAALLAVELICRFGDDCL
jgi:hypothetical protein